MSDSSSLLCIQSDFAQDLLGEGSCSSNCMGAGGLDGENAIAIYRNNFFQSYLDALTMVYGQVRTLVGAEFFRYLCRGFIHDVPYDFGSLNNFGDGFDQYVAGFSGCQDMPFLVDLAALEWMIDLTKRSRVPACTAKQDLESIAPSDYPNLYVKFNPACCFLRSQFPIFSLWTLNAPEETQDLLASEGAQSALVFLYLDQCRVEKWSLGEEVMWHNLQNGCTLGQAYLKAASVEKIFSLEEFLGNCMKRDIICQFSLEIFSK